MKPFFLTLLMSFITLLSSAQSYDALWKKEQKQEQDGKPQSAYAIVQQILQKAEAEGHLGQMLSARLRAAALHQEWAPDSFFTDVAELEALRAQATRPEVKAVYASILAEVYQNNRSRTQARDLQLTSADMKEWTREQYDSAAIRNWQLSLADIPAVAEAKSRDWLPFVVQDQHSSYFGHDLLHILWQRVRDQRHRIWDMPEMHMQDYLEAVTAHYRQQGNRQAELLLRLDGVELRQQGQEVLETLRTDFADLPLCTEVYLRLLQTDAPDTQKVAWAQDALKRYPRYDRIGEVRNRLNELQRPALAWTGSEVYYPQKEYTWKLEYKNATAAEMVVYRLNEDFSEDAMNRSKQGAAAYIRQHGKPVQTLKPALHPGAPFETVEDSVRWTAPEVGRYAILYGASTSEKEALKKSVNNQYQLFRVTTLMTMQRSLPDGRMEVIVVDAESGQPVAEAEVTILKEDRRSGLREPIEKQLSDAEGRARFHGANLQRTRCLVQAVKGEDHWMPVSTAFNNTPRLGEEQQTTTLRLYTDRAIYRPGQTVHIGGIAYTQQHWDAQALADKEYELILRDANWKEVDRQMVRTDAMGVLSTDFVLPEGRLPGNYRVQAGSASVYFRVEEYKRPTFEVKMDEAPALTWPQDSITLTGKAMGYNGAPIRDGRVTGTYRFTYPYFWWYRHDDSAPMPIDTVATDDTGTFLARVPLCNIPAEALKYGLYLALDVEVLSPAGETRAGSIRVPLCTTPLRLTVRMNEKQDRDRLTPPTFTCLSSTGKPAEADIRCTIISLDTGQPAATDLTPAAIPDALRALPSGDYELRATATASAAAPGAASPASSPSAAPPSGSVSGGLSAGAAASPVTAQDSTRFYLFSLADTRLPRHAASWLYCPTDTFDAAHPARVQVGSSFPDVALYYCLMGPSGIVKDELITLSDELRLFEIPYKDEYGDGLTASFAFVKHGQAYQQTQTLRLTRPDTQLRWEWTTFRDRLHPGDQETWTLRLTRPDGTPATANLMAVIYDASLDQLAPHAAWQMSIGRAHRLLFSNWTSQNFFGQGNASMHLYFPMKDYRVPGLSFDRFDDQWMNGLYFFGATRRLMGANRVMMAKSSRAEGMVMEEAAVYDGGAVQVTSAPTMADVAADDAILNEKVVVGYGAAKEDAEAETETVSAASPAIRTNFNETAAFMPRLHSDPTTGEVTLSFTLPESLTTWQFLGLAHTADMQTADIQAQAIARKEMMARLYLPRFLRAGDQSSIRAVVQNLTDAALSGKAKLEIFDPETNKVLTRQTTNFEAKANGEAVLAFDYTPAEEPTIVAVRLIAETTPARITVPAGSSAGKPVSFSDGEQQYLPILPAKEWMTESVEIQADGKGTFTTDLSSLFNNDSPSATHRRLTVEYTTHPIWNVVQALPALREPQTDDVLSLASVFYANTLAAHIAATTPRLQDIITLWKQQAAITVPAGSTAGRSSSAASTGASPASSSAGRSTSAPFPSAAPLSGSVSGGSSAGAPSTTSPLARNEELKQLILDETPWLREADNDTQRRAQLIDLFNENLVSTRLTSTLDRLSQRQQPDGGFSWFPGMRSSELMTRLVCIDLTQLRTLTNDFSKLPAVTKQKTNTLLQKAFGYVAEENAKLIQELKKAEAKGSTIHTGSLMHLHYVYIAQRAGVKLTAAQKADVRYLLDHLKGTVGSMSNDERAMAAIVLKTDGRTKDAQLYFDSMREHLTTTPQRGTFFDYASGNFTPTGHKVIIHTTAMEAVQEMKEASLQSGMRRWLLQQKRTQMWESSICTVNAIYALLRGAAADLEDTSADRITLNLKKGKVDVSKASSDVASPAAMGYIKQTITPASAPKSITVQRTAESEAWGAVYAQYLTPVADASAHAAGLTIRRELSSATPRLGDKLTTRYVITADRDYEYVCLRADRAACAEPAEQRSGYRYQGGLGYYRAVRDAHTDYFFDRLPKGTYVLEETAFTDRTGRYTTGLVNIRCLYAPEFGGNTLAVELTVK